AKKRLMVENSLNRYKIGSADNLKADADGSVTLYIQADSPGKDKESNWLPAPKEPFYMLMRMYLPDIEALNGQYELPGVDSLNQHGAVLGGQATVWPAPNRRSSRNVRSSAGVELGAG
ncbi:MAG: DUF1214 domain-containing protein, partial [Hyphomicrobiaceae bacterium]|nr:DUF1214 domain-containing protein [Hyphomicrobiaceae bacterium]